MARIPGMPDWPTPRQIHRPTITKNRNRAELQRFRILEVACHVASRQFYRFSCFARKVCRFSTSFLAVAGTRVVNAAILGGLVTT